VRQRVRDLFLVLAATATTAAADGTPLTQIPHLVKFVENTATAPHLADLAEFSIRLMQWNDSDREAILQVQRLVKNETYAQEWGAQLDYSPLSLDKVVELTSKGYSSLKSPRLARVTIGSSIVIEQKPSRMDLVAGQPIPVPFLFHNGTTEEVELTVRSATPQLDIDAARARLRPSQILGLYLNLTARSAKLESVRLQFDAGNVRGEIEASVQTREARTLRVQVMDDQGRKTPARVYLSGPDGRSYTPVAAVQRITNGDYGQPYGGEYYFHTNGEFEATVPAGQVKLEIVKGLEYAPVQRTLDMNASDASEIIKLSRPFSMAARGWYSGDVHIHPNLFGDDHITPADVLFMAQAEDLNVSNNLICNDEREPVNDLDRFTGAPHELSTDQYILYWNQEMRNLRLYGHMAFLKLKSLVQPYMVGWPGTTQPYDFPANYTQALKAKEQGAVVTYVHPSVSSEYPVDIALGAAETIDVMCQGDEERNTQDWYRLLNSGFQCPLSAGTDTYLNIPYHLIPGAGRVYVETGPTLTYDAWIDGFQKGKSFVTNAPLLTFSVNGRGAGADITLAGGPQRLIVEATASSHVPMQQMEVIVNGRPVWKQEATHDGRRVEIKKSITVNGSSWIAVRVRGESHRLVPNDRLLYAHSSPVYCTLPGKPLRVKADALYFADEIEKSIGEIHKKGLFSQAGQKEQVIGLFRKAQQIYRQRAEEAM
jgi:hypothetical protein